jgi:hypothetical protein
MAKPPTMPRMTFSALIFSSSEDGLSFFGFSVQQEPIERAKAMTR